MHEALPPMFRVLFLGWIPSIVIARAEREHWHIEIG